MAVSAQHQAARADDGSLARAALHKPVGAMMVEVLGTPVLPRTVRVKLAP